MYKFAIAAYIRPTEFYEKDFHADIAVFMCSMNGWMLGRPLSASVDVKQVYLLVIYSYLSSKKL